MNRLALRVLWWGGVFCAGAWAQAPTGPAGERQRLAGERAAVQARYVEHEAACQQRFAVTACVNDAKKERRNALAPLRRLEAALDDAQRKQRTAQRNEDLRRKMEGAQARGSEVVVREPAGAASAPLAGEAAAVPTPEPREPRESRPRLEPRPQAARPRPMQPTAAERRKNEAEAQARIDARKQVAAAHREEAERRNAQRALSGKRADPLPAPSASAAAP